MPRPVLLPKYCAVGGFTRNTFRAYPVPRELVSTLVEAANHGLAKNTHKAYKTAVNHIKRIENTMGRKLRFPFSYTDTLTYIGYLLKVRKVSGSTLEKYLSGIRMAHMQRGILAPWLKPEIVKLIVTGAENKTQLMKRMQGKRSRQPITPELMAILQKLH